jgi:hypothetical protein
LDDKRVNRDFRLGPDFHDSSGLVFMVSKPGSQALWQRQSAQTSRDRREGYKPKKAVGDKCYKAKANKHGDDL